MWSGEPAFYNNPSYFNSARYAPLVLLCAYTLIYILSLLSLHYLCIFNIFIPILIQRKKIPNDKQTRRTMALNSSYILTFSHCFYKTNACNPGVLE